MSDAHVSIEARRQAAHDGAVRAGRDGYFDPDSGLFVMTADYLKRRGTCCSSSCRHCPYQTGDQFNP